MRIASIVTVVIAVSLTWAAAAPAATLISGPICGSFPVKLDDGSLSFGRNYSKLRHVTCKAAKAVVAHAGRTRDYACGAEVNHQDGWTIRHAGPKFALSSRYARGKQSFEVSEEGSC